MYQVRCRRFLPTVSLSITVWTEVCFLIEVCLKGGFVAILTPSLSVSECQQTAVLRIAPGDNKRNSRVNFLSLRQIICRNLGSF